MEMLGARDHLDWPPEEGTAAGLQAFAVDKNFLSSLRGILLETELDFLRCVSAIVIFLVISIAAVTSRDGAAIAAFVFGIILVSVFAYDIFKIYQTEMAPRATEALGPQLVDLGLSDICPLLCLIQLVLHLAELGKAFLDGENG
ncbi:CKLF-like MARVEL transmembrane domain-containing protein 5 isoform 2-T2 [Trichechus inunguis]